MFLSIIVPVFNTEAYLPACLHSLLRQDISPEDYEILCVNDGSTDGSAAVIAACAAEHPNVRLLEQPNSGVAAARNRGLGAARGDYVWFVDSDDLIQENVLSRLRRAVTDRNCDLLYIGAYQFHGTLTGEEVSRARSGALPDNGPGAGSVVWRSLIRLQFLRAQDMTFRHPELTHGEDGQFMYELALLSPRTADFAEPVYFYRLRSGSAETSASPENRRRKLRSHIAVAKIMGECFASRPTHTATADRMMAVLWCALYDAAGFPAKEARQVLSELRSSGLFPFRRPAACSLRRSYMTSRTDWAGRAFDWLYMHQHTRWGFALMWSLRQAMTLVRRR